jgi:hypothetical protein
MAGVAQHPSRETYIELAKRIQIEGGKVLTQRHSGAPVKFPESLNAETRSQAESGAQTCGCGDTRMVTIPYVTEREIAGSDETVRTEKRYVACVNCDAVALQPRWTQGRWADASGR